MNQKVVRVALAVLVLLIWGAVIARALRGKKSPPSHVTTAKAPKVPDTLSTHVDAIRFDLVRDPFLGDPAPRPRAKAVTRTQPLKSPSATTSPPKAAPTAAHAVPVEYLGYMRSGSDATSAFAMVKIGVRQHLIRVGTTEHDIHVRSANANSVVIIQDGKEVTLKR
ncbi:MAG: hypothetical protein KDC00_11085 [Flavobacteriales bacterium]|nr:hypothetical protein [Flavobacteriales bacterium]